VVIPKSTSVDHLRENMDIFDWELSVAQMVALDGLG
jgi:diketogulonate reductase-like aldo/keto reductase